jgi:hypothetical protein
LVESSIVYNAVKYFFGQAPKAQQMPFPIDGTAYEDGDDMGECDDVVLPRHLPHGLNEDRVW